MAAISAEGTRRPADGVSARPDVHDDARDRGSKRWAGAGRSSGSPVLAVFVLSERLEPPLDQLARVVPQLADQPLPPPPQPPDRSTNIVQREQPRLCLSHEALLFCCRSRGSLGQCPAARATKRLTKLADSSTRRTDTGCPPIGMTQDRRKLTRPGRLDGQSPLRGDRLRPPDRPAPLVGSAPA